MNQREAWRRGYRPDPAGFFCDWIDSQGRPWMKLAQADAPTCNPDHPAPDEEAESDE